MQNIKKYFMTLALLLTAVTGAWAQSALNVVEFEVPATWNGDNNPVTAADLPGFKAVTLDEAKTWTGAPAKGMAMLFYAFENTINLVNYNNGTGSGATAEFTKKQVFSLKSGVKFYYTAKPTTFPFPITWDATNKTTGFELPAGNVFMNVEYYPAAALATAPAAKSDIKATTDDAIVTAGTVAKIGETTDAQGTLMYYAVQSETTPEAPDYDNKNWSDKVPTAADFNEGNVYIWYYVKGADGDAESTFNDGAITKLGESGYVTLAAAPTYAITLKEDTEEFDKWAISSAKAIKGTTITATYSGSRKVKSVKAVKVAPAATDLSTINAKYTVSNGETLTGTLASNVQISIAAGATVTLNNVNINGVNDSNYEWAGITCEGDATIILNGTNTVKGFADGYPGIFVSSGKTIVINGTGELIASSNGTYDTGSGGAGIGGGNKMNCGNIEIQSGTVTATGNQYGAGIGGGQDANCGNITISGGTVTATGGYRAAGIGGGRRSIGGTLGNYDSGSCGNITISGGTVTATGGQNAAGIGGGRGNNNNYKSSCGTITITSGVTEVTATKGSGADNSIGAGNVGTCGTVTIGGNEGAITTSPYTYQPE